MFQKILAPIWGGFRELTRHCLCQIWCMSRTWMLAVAMSLQQMNRLELMTLRLRTLMEPLSSIIPGHTTRCISKKALFWPTNGGIIGSSSTALMMDGERVILISPTTIPMSRKWLSSSQTATTSLMLLGLRSSMQKATTMNG